MFIYLIIFNVFVCHVILGSVESLFWEDVPESGDNDTNLASYYYSGVDSSFNTQVSSGICVDEHNFIKPKSSWFKRMNRALSKLFLNKD